MQERSLATDISCSSEGVKIAGALGERQFPLNKGGGAAGAGVVSTCQVTSQDAGQHLKWRAMDRWLSRFSRQPPDGCATVKSSQDFTFAVAPFAKGEFVTAPFLFFSLTTRHSSLTTASFVPQGHHWINSGGAVGRNDAGAKPDHAQKDDDTRKAGRVARAEPSCEE